ncbi:MAG TPA: beta-N-acetylhexosaminidase, partial [Sediminibacterium sp.]
MKKCLLTLITLTAAICLQAQVSIIPRPANMTVGKGTFTVDRSTVIVIENASLGKQAAFLKDYLTKIYQLNIPVRTGMAKSSSHAILLKNIRKQNEIKGAYQLEVTGSGITITGDDAEGVFYGVQSVIQLLPVQVSAKLQVPQVSIQDAPRFSYRGMMLDVGRHFFPVSFV